MTGPEGQAAKAPDDAERRVASDVLQQLVEPAGDASFLAELTDLWGRWGAWDEVGPLRRVAVRAPGPELSVIRGDAWNEDAQALVDPDGRWYWADRVPPDLGRVGEQHHGLVEAMRADGIEVDVLDSLGPPFVKSVYVRDPVITVPGGAIIVRPAVAMRRGEEAAMSRELASLGMPVLGTITGNGTLEGGSFAKLTPGLAAVGVGCRSNHEGAEQLRGLIAGLGMDLLVTPLTGYSIHIDLHLAMVDRDKALVTTAGLTYDFLQQLKARGIGVIEADADEYWGINLLCLGPGRVLMAEGSPITVGRLEAAGVEVVTIPYGEVQKGGGGIHCSTIELVRDRAG